MAATVEIPLVGGSADGQLVTVELDPNDRPPLTHHHVGSGGLAEADIYELESIDAQAQQWCYRWRGQAV
ncbi:MULTISPECIES: hypothetical protein [Micromonospora]|uniref:Uncharacterized protein n=1 Tax=Micromonospora maris TaxID=1003110 RepID=A0A9X0I2Y0_9ACTN|nr:MULTISPECIES: hypothetical protein [Micromonospora]AEB46606.1 hypothetical protein VAB18032_27666 [Micromonospora maris AB-18-032]KUJ45808.1 hypothetical protein ADL17_22600 [Micromonospora maris]RUL90870.1 hypothetical protein EG812_24250 [Verrucosispora sp. FIM060022]